MPDETLVSATTGTRGATGFGPPEVPGEVGTLGPYRLVKELGKGGMGAVYAALDTRLERRLALKVMLPDAVADAGAKDRFLREARAAARVKHDNVVTVYEADERNGVPYIAMEFLEGCPLDVFLKSKGGLPIPQVLRVGAETASGLEAAHKLGLVHRDIKPANLWLEAPNGRVKVLDFGLAKPVDTEVELTKSGMVVGTPAYMSPEQGRGLKVDARSDVFSLGVVLYRLCTGQMPFTGPTTMAVLMALGNDDPTPVRDLNPNAPDALAALVHQMLAKKPDARPQSAAEVAQRLRAIAAALAGGHADVSASHPQVMQPQVVYAVTPVTAVADTNPFADLDSPETEFASHESNTATGAPLAEPARPRAKWPWLVAALAGLVAVAVTAALALKGRGEREPEPPPPPPPPPLPHKPAVAPFPSHPNRRVAEWVHGLGGVVRLVGETFDRLPANGLPPSADYFEVERVLLNRHPGALDLNELTRLERLSILELSGTSVSQAGFESVARLKGLIHLNIDGSGVTDEGLKCVGRLSKLETLYASGGAVTDAGAAELAGLGKLTFLRLDCPQVTDTGLLHLRALKQLAHLEVRSEAVTAKGVAAVRAALPACKIVSDVGTFEPIDVDRKVAEWVIARGGYVRLNGGNKNVVAQANLPKTPFALTAAHIKDTDALADGDLLSFCEAKNLTRISVANTPITDAGLAHLARVKGLAHLDLSGTRVTGPGLAHLKECEKLELLLLGNTKLTADALAHLKGCKNLQALSVQNAPVGDAGLKQLAEVKGLKVLNVRDTGASAKAVEALRAALPGCEIDHDGAPERKK